MDETIVARPPQYSDVDVVMLRCIAALGYSALDIERMLGHRPDGRPGISRQTLEKIIKRQTYKQLPRWLVPMTEDGRYSAEEFVDVASADDEPEYTQHIYRLLTGRALDQNLIEYRKRHQLDGAAQLFVDKATANAQPRIDAYEAKRAETRKAERAAKWAGMTADEKHAKLYSADRNKRISEAQRKRVYGSDYIPDFPKEWPVPPLPIGEYEKLVARGVNQGANWSEPPPAPAPKPVKRRAKRSQLKEKGQAA